MGSTTSRDRQDGSGESGASRGNSHDKGSGGNGRDRTGPARGPSRVGNATVADHMIAHGGIGTPSIGAGGVAQGNFSTKDDAYGAYSKAVGDYATRGVLGRAADWALGPFFDQNEPMSGNPRSFSGGTYHSSSSPGGILGSLAGGALGIPGTGFLAGTAYNAAGLPDIWHGGYGQPDIRVGPLGNAPAGTDMGRAFSDLHNNLSFGGPPSYGGPGQYAGGGGGQGGGSNPAQTAQGPTPTQAAHPEAFSPSPWLGLAQQPQQPAANPYSGQWNSIPGPSPYGWQGYK